MLNSYPLPESPLLPRHKCLVGWGTVPNMLKLKCVLKCFAEPALPRLEPSVCPWHGGTAGWTPSLRTDDRSYMAVGRTLITGNSLFALCAKISADADRKSTFCCWERISPPSRWAEFSPSQRCFQRSLYGRRVPVDGLRLPHLNHLRFILIELFNVFRRTCPAERPFSAGSTETRRQLHPFIEVAVAQPCAAQKRFGTLSLQVRLHGGDGIQAI